MKFRYAKDSLFEKDKLFHLVRDTGLYLFCRYILHLSEFWSWFAVTIFQQIWEYKDGKLYWEWFMKPDWIPLWLWVHLNPGGDGYSYWDNLPGQLSMVAMIVIF